MHKYCRTCTKTKKGETMFAPATIMILIPFLIFVVFIDLIKIWLGKNFKYFNMLFFIFLITGWITWIVYFNGENNSKWPNREFPEKVLEFIVASFVYWIIIFGFWCISIPCKIIWGHASTVKQLYNIYTETQKCPKCDSQINSKTTKFCCNCGTKLDN